MLAAILHLCRYLRWKLFDVASVGSFICTTPSASWPYFLMVLSSYLNIPKGQLPQTVNKVLMNNDLANTLMKPEKEIRGG